MSRDILVEIGIIALELVAAGLFCFFMWLRAFIRVRRTGQNECPSHYYPGLYDRDCVHVARGPQLFGWPLFCGSFAPGFGWFRVWGVGLTWKDSKRHELMFSERNGYTRRLRVGSWGIGVLWW